MKNRWWHHGIQVTFEPRIGWYWKPHGYRAGREKHWIWGYFHIVIDPY